MYFQVKSKSGEFKSTYTTQAIVESHSFRLTGIIISSNPSPHILWSIDNPYSTLVSWREEWSAILRGNWISGLQSGLWDEKVEEHAWIAWILFNYNIHVGMKSRLDDSGCIEWKSFETFVGVKGEIVDDSSPEWIGSARGGCRHWFWKWKKFKNVIYFIELLLSE